MSTRYVLIFLLVVVLALGCFCCEYSTPSIKNPEFEQQILIFVREKKPHTEMVLFNGKDLSGWETHRLGRWSVHDGILKVSGGLGYLSTRCDEFTDFILTLKVRAGRNANSGVFFRAQPSYTLWPWPKQYEAQIDNHDPKNPTGSLYNRVRAGSPPPQDGEWFEMEISAVGTHIQIKINGSVVVDTEDSRFQKGFIALQAHDFGSTVEFQEIKVRIP